MLPATLGDMVDVDKGVGDEQRGRLTNNESLLRPGSQEREAILIDQDGQSSGMALHSR